MRMRMRQEQFPQQQQVPQQQFEQLKTQVEQVTNYLQPRTGIESKDMLDMLVNHNYRVLQVDEPDREHTQRLADELRESDCIVETVDSWDARKRFKISRLWDAAIINVDLKEPGEGISLTHQLRRIDQEIPIILYVNDSQDQYRKPASYHKRIKKLFGEGVDYVSSGTNSGDFRGSEGELLLSMELQSSIQEAVEDSQKGKTLDEVTQTLHDTFLQTRLKKRQLAALKWGGSFYDLILEEDEAAGARFRNDLLHFNKRHRGEFAYTLFVGGGKVNDQVKDWLDNPYVTYKAGSRFIEETSRDVLQVQARSLRALLGEENARILDPDQPARYGVIDDAMFDDKPFLIVPYAPKEARRALQLSLAHSDSNTLAAAAYMGAERVLFAKRVGGPNVRGIGGIYTSDPQRERFDAESEQKLLQVTPHEFLHGRVRVGDIEYGLSRIGSDGRGDHLCETHALECMEIWKRPSRVIVADPRTPRLLERVYVEDDLVRRNEDGSIDYENSLSSIVQPDLLTLR